MLFSPLQILDAGLRKVPQAVEAILVHNLMPNHWHQVVCAPKKGIRVNGAGLCLRWVLKRRTRCDNIFRSIIPYVTGHGSSLSSRV